MYLKIKDILKQYFSNFYYFYTYLRYKIIIILIVTSMVGLLDGLGLALFLPLLEMIANESGTSSSSQMGNLAFIVDIIKFLGFELTLVTILFSMLFFFVLKGGFKFLELYLRVLYQQFFIRNIRESNIKFLSEYSYEAFVNANAGIIQNTMSGEVERVVQAYRAYMEVMKSSVTILVYIALAFLTNPQFAILVAAGGYLTNILFNTLYKKTKVLSRELVKSSHGFQGLLIQQVAFFKYLKATGLIRTYAGKLLEKIYDIEGTQKKIGAISAFMGSVREPLIIGVVIAVIIFQINVLGESLGLILLSILFFYRALLSIMQLQTYWNQFLSFSGSLENLRDFILELKSGRERNGTVSFNKFNNEISLRNVDFTYIKTPTLNKVSLQIYKNETVAFVGKSGSGKTTLLNVISGLIKPQNGQFMIDGISADKLNNSTYTKRIGYITQEPVIFDDTVFNNVSFWSQKSPENMNKFYESLIKASIYDFIMNLKEKENSRLGNNGINLSGGQKQRISIARELYKDIDILIMDEATSALDTETEKTIQNNINELKGKYTILIAAHRLSTIKNADRIIVIKNGRISQIGSYTELISRGEDFKHMVELQEM